jgi:hypothetical protein
VLGGSWLHGPCLGSLDALPSMTPHMWRRFFFFFLVQQSLHALSACLSHRSELRHRQPASGIHFRG